MGIKGSNKGQFIEDHGIAVDKQGKVYVVDTRNVRIQNLIVMVIFLLCGDHLGVKMINF